MTPADRFDHVSAQFDRLVGQVPAGSWGIPTGCEGWTAGDVLRHVVDTQRDLLDRMGFDPPSLDGLEPTDAWEQVHAAMSAAVHDPARVAHAYDGYFGPTTFGRTVDDFYSFDLVVHRWDIAHALGLAEHEVIDAGEVARLRANAAVFGDAARMPGILGPELPAPDGATEQEALLAWLGRDPRA